MGQVGRVRGTCGPGWAISLPCTVYSLPLYYDCEERWRHSCTWTSQAPMRWLRRSTKLHWPSPCSCCHCCCCCLSSTTAGACNSTGSLHQKIAYPNFEEASQDFTQSRKLATEERVTVANDVATCVYLGEEGTAGTWLVGFQRRATYLH